MIDKGLPTAGLPAQVLVAKYLDYLPLHRQAARCSNPPANALVDEMLQQDVLHADEMPVAMLEPGKGKTHRAYLWNWYTNTTQFNPLKAVVFDFAETRGGQHARDFLRQPGHNAWKGTLVADDFSGYKALFQLGVTEAGCMAHARRKFYELWANHGSQVGEQALKFYGRLCEIERDVADLDPEQRRDIRQQRSRPVIDALGQWLNQQRQVVPMARRPPGRSTTASGAGRR